MPPAAMRAAGFPTWLRANMDECVRELDATAMPGARKRFKELEDARKEAVKMARASAASSHSVTTEKRARVVSLRTRVRFSLVFSFFLCCFGGFRGLFFSFFLRLVPYVVTKCARLAQARGRCKSCGSRR